MVRPVYTAQQKNTNTLETRKSVSIAEVRPTEAAACTAPLKSICMALVNQNADGVGQWRPDTGASTAQPKFMNGKANGGIRSG